MNYRCTISIIIGVLVCIVPFDSEAQLLKKVAKGLEKVNKGLERVTGTTNQPDQQRNGNASIPSPVQSTSTLNESGWQKVEAETYNKPYLTPNSRYLKVSGRDVSDVSDGVFAVNRMGKYEFWRVDGKKLYDADWKCVGENSFDFPRFVGGVTAAGRVSSNGRIYLLYLDGHIKECDPSWEKVSTFCDGLAMVKAKVNQRSEYFFIDVSGQKVFPNLSVNANSSGSLIARPLKNGLRAFPTRLANDPYKEVWGFIDASGNVKIAPKFKNARDFSEGYAWVELDGTMQLIDTTGKVVWNSGENSYAKISDVHNGIVYIEHNAKLDYYDVTGKILASFAEGNAFYDGMAFVMEPGKENPTLINTEFQPLRSVFWKILPPSDISQYKPVFEPYGLATVNSKTIVLNPEGNVVLQSYDNHKGTQIGGFGQFSASGYSLCTSVEINGATCGALMKPSGEIVWLFSDNQSAAGPYEEGKLPPYKPLPREPPIKPGDPLPPPIIIVDNNMPPVGPTTVQPVKYKVSVVAEPAEGGIVNLTPGGTFGYGDYATVTAAANDEWAVGYVSTSVDGETSLQVGKPFLVTADQTITVHFIKKDEDTKPDNIGSFQGILRLDIDEESLYNIPVYLSISDNESTPYGESTYGYMSVMFDQSTRYTNKKQTVAVSLYAAPLKVCGVQTDVATGQKWLVLDGGSMTANDLKINPAGEGGFYGMLMNMMIGFDGFSSINTIPRHYRLEMRDIDENTGEFTGGLLETFLPEAGGWVSGDDKRLHNTRTGMFGSVTDKGYPADCLLNVRFKKSAQRTDVQWYPPESWAKNANAYKELIEAMGAAYRTARSDYYKLFE